MLPWPGGYRGTGAGMAPGGEGRPFLGGPDCMYGSLGGDGRLGTRADGPNGFPGDRLVRRLGGPGYGPPFMPGPGNGPFMPGPAWIPIS